MNKKIKILFAILIAIVVYLIGIIKAEAMAFSIASHNITNYGAGAVTSKFQIYETDDYGNVTRDITGGPDKYNGYCIVPRWTTPTGFQYTVELTDSYVYTTPNGTTIPIKAIVYYMYGAPGFSEVQSLFSSAFGENSSTNSYEGYSLIILSYAIGRTNYSEFFPGRDLNDPETEWYKYWDNGAQTDSVLQEKENDIKNILNTIGTLYQTDKTSNTYRGFKAYYSKGTSSSEWTQDLIFWDNTPIVEPKGAIKIKKEFVSGSEDFSKFSFKIKNSSNQVVATITPNSSGYACYGYANNSTCSGDETLDVGDQYTVEEVIDSSVSHKWVALQSSISIVIKEDANKTNGLDATFKNRKRLYCVAVKKVDAENTNTVLSGVGFKIGDTTQTTGSNGIATFTNLDYQGYTISEASAKDGYFNDSGNISVSASDLTEMNYSNNTYTCPSATVKTYTKSDHKRYYCIKVYKVDSVTGGPLTGASFKTTINGTEVTHADNWDGSNDGYTTFFTETQSGNFTVTETTAPTGYAKYEGTLTAVAKVMEKSSGYYTKSEAEAACKTANPTTFTNTSIPTFPNTKYVVNWYKTTEDNTRANGAEFVVYTTVNNATKYVKVKSSTVTRKDENNTTKTCYEFDSLVDNISSASTLKSMNTNTNNSASNGEFCIIGVDKGKNYTAKETKTVDYHTFGSEITKTVSSSNKYATKSNDNTFVNYKTVFTFTKTVSSGDETTTLKNVTTAQLKNIAFEVYKLDANGKITGNALSFRKTSDGVYEYAANTIDLPSGTATTDLYLNDSRKITIYHLAYGDYGIIEKGSPKNGNTCACDGNTCTGFYSPGNSQTSSYKFTINECSNADANVNACSTTPKAATQTLQNIPTEIKFTKSDFYSYVNPTDTVKFENDEEVKAFDKIKFRIYTKNSNGTKNYLSLVKTSTTCSSNTDAAVYRYVPNNLVSQYNLSSSTDLYTCNGNIRITNLCRGQKYYIEEVEVPSNTVFTLPETEASRTVEYNIPCCGDTTTSTSTKQVINDKPTRVAINKVDARTNNKLDDETTTFEVYQCKSSVSTCTSSNGKLIHFSQRAVIPGDTEDSNKEVYKFIMNNTGGVTELHPYHGELIFKYLPAGYKYILVEKVAPNGYYNPDASEAATEFTVSTVATSSNQNYESLTNNVLNTPTEIIFIKNDFYRYYSEEDIATLNSNIKLFDTAKFALRDKDGNILKLTKLETNDEEGNVYKYVKNGGNITNINTYKGKLKIINLPRTSVYYIEEIETTDPANLVLLNENITYSSLPFDNQGHQVVKYTLEETKPANQSSVTREISNKPTRIRFEKRDSKYGYLIPDETATFKVYQCAQGVDCHPSEYSTDEERLAAGIKLINFESRTVIAGDEEDPSDEAGVSGVEVYKYKKLNASGVTELHPYHGILVLRYLPAEYNYVLLETVAPVNYLLPIGENAEIAFTVSSETVQTAEIDMPNAPTSLLIRKYDDEGSLLEGAQFRIYEGTTCDANLSAMNQPKTLLKLKTIRDGVYENRPVADTDIIQTCSDKNGLCKNIPVDAVTKLTYTDYIGTWSDFSELLNTKKDTVELRQGEILVQYLEYNHCYIIEEVKAPKGYSLPKNQEDRYTMVTIKENEQYAGDTYKTLINKPTPFTFYKYDEYGNPLDGAEFKLQVLDDNKKYQDVTVTKEEVNGEFFYKADETSSNRVITTKDGKATVYYLPAGQYRILETKPAPGKELSKNANIATFFVDDSGNVYGNSVIVNKSKTEKIEIKGSSSAELVVAPRTGQTVIEYGLLIAVLSAVITGLMILVKKTK